VLRCLVGVAKRDIPVEGSFNQRATYLDVCTHGREDINWWNGLYESDKEVRIPPLALGFRLLSSPPKF